jgi:hypothetical protein
MVFSAAALVILAIAWPKYVRRQGRLELQYYAGEEITRRRVQGEPAARESGHEGNEPPPAAGELIVSLWPIVALLSGLLLFSAFMYRRDRRGPPARQPPVRGPA